MEFFLERVANRVKQTSANARVCSHDLLVSGEIFSCTLKTHFFPSLARPPLHDHRQYTVLITERTSKAYLI